MTQPLFRSEMLDGQRRSGLGGISLARPPALWVAAVAACATIVAIGVFLSCGSYTRRATVIGQLVPVQGMASVAAPASGVVEQLQVREGDRVVAGQVLAVVAVPRTTFATDPTTAAIEAGLQGRQSGLQSTRQGQLHALAAQASGLTRQLAAARDELEQVRAEAATRERQIRIGEEALARLRALHDRQYVSQVQLQQQEAVVLDQVSALQALQRQAGALNRGIVQLQQSLDQLPGQRQAIEAAVQQDLAALAQERAQMNVRNTFVITAPASGVVAMQVTKRGQAVQSGQILLSLLPGSGELEAELLVPSRAIGFIEPGDRVLLRYQAYPWQKFGHQPGKVASISRSALGPGEAVALARLDANAQPLYRVTVSLARQTVMAYGKVESLRPGMVLDADILGETRRLVEWLFEPLYSVRGRFVAS